MRALVISLVALSLASCASLEPVTDPVTGRVGGFASLGLRALADAAYVMRAGDLGADLPPACLQYRAIKRRSSEVTPESTTALFLCSAALDATEEARAERSIEVEISPAPRVAPEG